MERGPEYKSLIEDLGFGGKKEGEARPEAVQRELEREIALIARIFSRQYEMDVLPSNAWACGLGREANEIIEGYLKGEIPDIKTLDSSIFRPKTITYDRESLEREPEDEIIGKIRHEIGHAKRSDYRLLAEGMKLAKDQGYLPTSWVNIANAIEDPWINNLESRDSETVRQKITTLYEQWKKDTLHYIGSQPVTRQLGLNIIYYWLTGESIPTLKNEEVLKVFGEIEPHLQDLFQGESAEENFDRIKREVWDKYRVLEKRATEDEAMRKMMESAARDLVKRLQEQGGEGEEKEGEGILSKIRETLGGKGGKSRKGQELTDNLSRQIPSATKKAIEDALREQVERQEGAETAQGKQEEKGERGISSGVRKGINLDELPQELKDELQALLNKLPKELKKQLEDAARQELDRKQAEALNKTLPEFIKLKKDKQSGEYRPEFETKDEKEIDKAKQEVETLKQEMGRKEAEELEQQSRESEERRQREREESERRRQEKEMAEYGFTPEERDDYLKFRQFEDAMRSQVENFLKILDRYLPKKEEYTYTGEYFIGKRPDFSKLAQKIPIKRYDIFRRREVQESSEAKLYVTLVIDNSGSMAGQKMEESLKTAIFFARVLKRFEIPFAVKFFGDHPESIKDFDDDYDDPTKRIKPKLVMLSDASGSRTNVGEPLEMTEKDMAQAKRKFPGSYGAIFVISDGGANAGRVGAELKQYIEELQKTYVVDAFGLGSGAAQELKGYFGDNNTAAVDDFSKLPPEAFKVLRVTLERILKLLRKI